MASFANQTSNLSALESKFDQLLKVQNPSKDSGGYLRSLEEKQRSTEAFFASQRNRVGNIEKELLTATANLLPPSTESKTITELAELCRLTQVATREKLEVLRSRLVNEGYTVTSPRTNRREGIKTTIKVSKSSPSLDRRCNRTRTAAAPSSTFIVGDDMKYISDDGIISETSLPLVANIGGPLESVLEAEYETDGMPTPGSYLESPALSSANNGPSIFSDDELCYSDTSATPSASARNEKIQNRSLSSSFTLRSPSTPPTLDKLCISVSTNRFLQHMEHPRENIEDTSLTNVSLSSGHNIYSSNNISFEETSKKPIVQEQYLSQQQEQHLYEFLDEDDMITLDTQSTMTKNNNLCSPLLIGGASNEKRLSIEERSQFFARMEGILERVEETILEESPSSRNRDESRKSNEHQGASHLFTNRKEEDQPRQHSIASTSSKDNLLKRPDRHSYKSAPIPNENDDDYSMNFSEDSTNMVATQVAEKGTSKDEITPYALTENNIKNQSSLNIFQQRPTHILVDTGVMSPAHTNITMDATFINGVNETSLLRGEENYKDIPNQLARGMIDYDTEEDDDNLSTVTPVLDRYRLDPSDDNSVGVKVVPNKRSVHRSNQKQTTTPRQGRLPTIAQLSPSLGYIIQARTPKKESNESDFMSPQIMTSERHLRSMNANISLSQKRKVYRKTPFPKRKLEDDISFNAIDENLNPNITAASSIPDTPEPFVSNEEHFSISVPPLRHSSFEMKRADESVLHLGTKKILSPPEKNRSSVSSEFPSAIFPNGASRQTYLQEETDTIQKIDETIERIDLELASPSRIYNNGKIDPIVKTTIQGFSESFPDLITEIEFESAPRIVQTNVSRDRANKALLAIRRYFSDPMVQFNCLEFTEKEGRDIVGFSDQESKSILISLCHWRRLMMTKDAIRGMTFAINDGKKERSKVVC